MSLAHTFTFRCSRPGCGREDLIEATVAEIHARADELGWSLHTEWIHQGGIDAVVAHDLCPQCASRQPAEGGAPSTPQAEPVGPDSGERSVGCVSPGTFPAPPPAVPAGGDLSVVTFLTAAGATGIGPCDGCQPPTFSPGGES